MKDTTIVDKLVKARADGAKRERERIAEFVWNYLGADICDICYEDNCGGEFSCTKGKYGEPCKCHSRINNARAKLEQVIVLGQ